MYTYFNCKISTNDFKYTYFREKISAHKSVLTYLQNKIGTNETTCTYFLCINYIHRLLTIIATTLICTQSELCQTSESKFYQLSLDMFIWNPILSARKSIKFHWNTL